MFGSGGDNDDNDDVDGGGDGKERLTSQTQKKDTQRWMDASPFPLSILLFFFLVW